MTATRADDSLPASPARPALTAGSLLWGAGLVAFIIVMVVMRPQVLTAAISPVGGSVAASVTLWAVVSTSLLGVGLVGWRRASRAAWAPYVLAAHLATVVMPMSGRSDHDRLDLQMVAEGALPGVGAALSTWSVLALFGTSVVGAEALSRTSGLFGGSGARVGWLLTGAVVVIQVAAVSVALSLN